MYLKLLLYDTFTVFLIQIPSHHQRLNNNSIEADWTLSLYPANNVLNASIETAPVPADDNTV
jgi:hypothetical protein